MATKPENSFLQAVHKFLPPELHWEKMHNIYRGGMADVWYSGPADDLWAEYKWVRRFPVRKGIIISNQLSALQQRWIDQRYKEGRNVVVIMGSDEGNWIFEHGAWNVELSPGIVREDGYTRRDVARYIIQRTMLSDHQMAV